MSPTKRLRASSTASTASDHSIVDSLINLITLKGSSSHSSSRESSDNHCEPSRQLQIMSTHNTSCLNKPLPSLPPPTPPPKATFKPINSRVSPKFKGLNLGESGWGTRGWKKGKAEREWLSEQKREYANQEHVFKEVVVKKLGGGKKVISGEEKWEAELRRVGGGKKMWLSSKAWGLGGTVIEMQQLGKSGSTRGEKDGVAAEKTISREEIEREKRWAENPPTPCPWPGQDDDDWNLDSPLDSARRFRK